MRILLLGHTGQVGWELQRTLAPLGQLTALDYPEIDLTEPEQVRHILREIQPTVVVNATAYTDVDGAEASGDLAMALNAHAPGMLAEEVRRLNAALIHYSTDYVFDGSKGEPYAETDQPDPVNAYGRTKLLGEQAVQQVGGRYLILRTSWVYSLRRTSFVSKVLAWARQQAILRVVDDQVSNPTWCRMLAEVTAQLLAMGRNDLPGWLEAHAGLYHLAGNGHASRLEWARQILALDPHRDEQVTREIRPARTAEFPTPAARPAFSALNCDLFTQTFGLALPPWQEALRLAMLPA